MSIKFKVNGDKTIKHNKIKAVLGLTNRKDHSTFYLEGGTFITPELENENFEEVMDYIKTSCKKDIKNKLNNISFLDKSFLMNFEVCSDRMKKDKNSYLSFQYHFKQKKGIEKGILNIKEENENFFIELLNDIENYLNSFNINLSKKRNNKNNLLKKIK